VVASFYQRVERHDFSGAAQLWTPRLRAEYPPPEYIANRFQQIRHIALPRLTVIAEDAAAGTAAVAVEVVENPGGPAERRSAGTWYLTRAGGRWLLDQPSFG
jgi:hypothetical protein